MDIMKQVFFFSTGEKSKPVQNLKSLQYSVILRQLTVVENAGQDRLSRQVSMPAEFGESYGNYAENFFSFGRSFVLLKILIFMLK